jgi:putative transcriptional regulator
MSQRHACFFGTLVMIVAFATAGTSDVNAPLRSRTAWDTKSKIPALLPAQFKSPDDLGVGKLLVASRDLADPNFAKTVILLVHYDSKGVLGVMLNRRTKIPLSRVLDQFKAAKDRSDPVYLGGPVETASVLALFRSPAKVDGAEPILNGVYFIADKAIFEKVISAGPKPDSFHVYLGYAGWTSKQLRQEVALGAWFIFPADTRTVFDSDPNSLWRQMIQKTQLNLALAPVQNRLPSVHRLGLQFVSNIW